MIKEQIKQLMIESMKAKDSFTTSATRLILSKIKDKEINSRTEESSKELSDDEVLLLLQQMIKQREDSISQYLLAKRQELADKEQQEIDIIKKFMPELISEEELEKIIKGVIADIKAEGIKDMGKVVNQIKTSYPGRVDMGMVSKKIKAILNSNL